MKRVEENKFKSVSRPKNLSSQIEVQLLKAINKGVFSVGDNLPSENKLSDIFKVSRGVIREALLLLSAKGIIEIKKGKGTKVLSPSIKTLLDPFSLLVNYKCGNDGIFYALEVRLMIEPQIAAMAATMRTEKDLQKLKKTFINMEKYKNDRKMFTFYDIEFHKKISISCGNPMFSILLEPIFYFLQTFHQEANEDLNSDQITFDYHQRVLEAIEQKDASAALNAMKEHLETGRDYVDKLIPD